MSLLDECRARWPGYEWRYDEHERIAVCDALGLVAHDYWHDGMRLHNRGIRAHDHAGYGASIEAAAEALRADLLESMKAMGRCRRVLAGKPAKVGVSELLDAIMAPDAAEAKGAEAQRRDARKSADEATGALGARQSVLDGLAPPDDGPGDAIVNTDKLSPRQLALLNELGNCRVGCGLPIGGLSRGDRAVLAKLIRCNLAWKVGGDFATVAMITGDGRERLAASEARP